MANLYWRTLWEKTNIGLMQAKLIQSQRGKCRLNSDVQDAEGQASYKARGETELANNCLCQRLLLATIYVATALIFQHPFLQNGTSYQEIPLHFK